MRKKIIQLPKGYISYSQLQLWKADRERYKKIYFEDRTDMQIRNKEMTYGSAFAKDLENEERNTDLLTDTALGLIPTMDVRDVEIRTVFKSKDGEITVMGRPDLLDSKSKDFIEVKTGKTKWTLHKAQCHLQMKFYAMLIYLAYKTIPRNISLVWVETEDTPTGIKPTGKIQSFKVIITLKDILQTMALTTQIAKEIEAEWLAFVPNPDIKNY